MANSTTAPRPKKPRPDFPLFPHASGRWCKKVRGRFCYFGPVAGDEGGQAALARWLDERDELLAGRTPRVKGEGLVLRDLLNRFLSAKQDLVDSGELGPRTWRDYKDVCDRLVEAFGKGRLVSDLAADDFEQLRRQISKKRKAVAIGTEVQRVRTVFRYAYDAGLLDRPVRYGPLFTRPDKKVIRSQKQKNEQANGKRLFSAPEVRAMLDAASVQMRAMIMLGINGGFGNGDCSTLPLPVLDLDSGWLEYPRPKTSVERRCPIWQKTVEALRAAIAERPIPKDESAKDCVFVTKYGKSWHKDTPDNPIANEMRKLLDRVGIKRKGCGFYALRHTFRTIADQTRDFPACDLIMGHTRADMASHYVEEIGDDRLQNVARHVHAWLWPVV